MKLVLLFLAIQIHPCDEPELLSSRVKFNQNLTAYWCSPKADNIEAATIYIKGVAINHTSIQQRTEENSTGLVQYSVNVGRLKVGKYLIIMTVWNSDGQSPPSQPFEVTVTRK